MEYVIVSVVVYLALYFLSRILFYSYWRMLADATRYCSQATTESEYNIRNGKVSKLIASHVQRKFFGPIFYMAMMTLFLPCVWVEFRARGVSKRRSFQ